MDQLPPGCFGGTNWILKNSSFDKFQLANRADPRARASHNPQIVIWSSPPNPTLVEANHESQIGIKSSSHGTT